MESRLQVQHRAQDELHGGQSDRRHFPETGEAAQVWICVGAHIWRGLQADHLGGVATERPEASL